VGYSGGAGAKSTSLAALSAGETLAGGGLVRGTGVPHGSDRFAASPTRRRVMTSFWGSSSAVDQLAAILQQGTEGSAALRRFGLMQAARRMLRDRISTTDLTPRQADIARVLAMDSAATIEAIQVIGTAVRWAEETGADRGTVAEGIIRLDVLGLLEVLEKGARHQPWVLRWVFSAAEWQDIEEKASAIIRRMLADVASKSRAQAVLFTKTAS
jgi:hypothetical protein